ncbi:MAG: hypothetical protein IT328_01495 [Caldilineaceae bacterium]|nr:hypothetical protein [Caldilineaceae bacterium]
MGTYRLLRVFGKRLMPQLLRMGKKSLLIGALVACLLPQTLLAAVTSDVTAGVLMVASDDADPIAVTCDGGNVKVNGADPTGGPFACNTITAMDVTGGPGDNLIDLNVVDSVVFTSLVTVTVDGAGANDVITGTFLADTLNGGEGNDTITGHRGGDTVNGGAGDDTMIWNNGDGSDTNDGGGGNDTTIVNGGGLSETFTITPATTGVLFQRLTQVPFSVNIISTTENLELNGNAGDETVTGTTGLSGVITMTLNGGDGNDTITGGDGPDTLNGDGGNDTLTGFRGSDTVNGGEGDDTMIWNNGDGSDTNDGGGGNDTTIVNGGGLSETFTITPTGTSVRLDRLTQVPFFVDIISTTENLELNGNAGDEIVTGTEELSGVITITINGGDGNDSITGGDGPDTINGDAGDDTLVGFKGADAVNGGDGDDTIIWNPGDGNDTNDGGSGNDTTVVNGTGISETFSITPTGTSVFFQRTVPSFFSVDILPTTENLLLNARGGADTVTGASGLSGVITMTLNGGDGDDDITGGDGPDTLNGGDGPDALNGSDGDDILVGFKGDDTMNGGSGNDTLVWNNGDGSDLMDGGDGDDTVVVNGGAISETFAITPAEIVAAAGLHAPLVGSVFFERVSPNPFELDIEAESVEVNGNDGSDTLNVTPLDYTDVFFNGGSQATADILRVDAQNRTVQVNPNQIVVTGKQPVTFSDVEVVEILNDALPVKLYFPLIKLND